MKTTVNTIFFVALIGLLSVFGVLAYQTLSTYSKVNKIDKGMLFVRTIKVDDPFTDPFVTYGKVIAKDGNYVQYVNDRGDTASFNAYLAFKYNELEIIK